MVCQPTTGTQMHSATSLRHTGGGEEVAQSDGEAIKGHRLAADRGHAGAQHNLGCMYEDGLQVAQSWEEATKTRATKLWRLAGTQGHVDAQLRLEICYERAQGAA